MQILQWLWLILTSTRTITGQFIFPNAESGEVFNDGDTVVVVWQSTFSKPFLLISCIDNTSIIYKLGIY